MLELQPFNACFKFGILVRSTSSTGTSNNFLKFIRRSVRRSAGRLFSSIGLYRISLVRASGESFRRRVFFPDMPGMKRVYRDKKSVGPLVGSQEKIASRPGDKPWMNHSSTGDFVPAFGLHRISLVRASGKTFGRRVFDALEGTRDPCLLGDQFCWHLVLPDPAPSPRRAPTRPARGMSGFWIRQVFDALNITRNVCLLDEQFCRRFDLPGSAPPTTAPPNRPAAPLCAPTRP